MDKPVLLWVDLTVSSRQAELPAVFTDVFEVRVCDDPQNLFGEIELGGIQGVCFDLDYPDRCALELLRKTKVASPSMAIIFITLQHSEALAIWAFRSRVLDYLVKPVSRRELERSVKALRGMEKLSSHQHARAPLDFSVPIPPEIPHRSRVDDETLLPAIYFVKQKFHEKFRSDDVAEACGMTTFRFSRSFHETYGLTFQDYVLRYRILEACRLLRNPSANITKVAYSVGFNDASYFSRVFKRIIGSSPSAYTAEFEMDVESGLDISSIRLMLNIPDAG